MSILIRNIRFAILPGCSGELVVQRYVSIAIDNGVITCIGDCREDAEHVIDGQDYVLLPGIINSHVHMDLSILSNSMNDRAYAEKIVEVNCIIALLTGSIGIIDLSEHPEIVAEKCSSIGLYAVTGPIINGSEQRITSLIAKLRDYKGVVPAIGVKEVDPQILETLAEMLKSISDEDLIIHYEIASNRRSIFEFYRKTGKWVFEYLVEKRLITSRTILGHVNWISSMEIELLKEYKPLIVPTPTYAMYIGERGFPPLHLFLKNNIPIAIGSHNPLYQLPTIWNEVKQLLLLHRFSYEIPVKTNRLIYSIATAPYRMLGISNGCIDVNEKAFIVLAKIEKLLARSLRSIEDFVINPLVSSIEYVISGDRALLSPENKEYFIEHIEKLMK
ncbi:MAG: amidohydrolase family protein [Thermoprotei archaeon]